MPHAIEGPGGMQQTRPAPRKLHCSGDSNKQEDAENPEGNERHGEEETGQGTGSADGKAGADFAEAPPPRGPLSSPRKEDGEE